MGYSRLTGQFYYSATCSLAASVTLDIYTIYTIGEQAHFITKSDVRVAEQNQKSLLITVI
ncbi:hypothetical protein OS42_44280 [Dickeya oryzae]